MINCLHTNFCIWTYSFRFFFFSSFADCICQDRHTKKKSLAFSSINHIDDSRRKRIYKFIEKEAVKNQQNPVLILCRFYATIPFKCCTRLINWRWFLVIFGFGGVPAMPLQVPKLSLSVKLWGLWRRGKVKLRLIDSKCNFKCPEMCNVEMYKETRSASFNLQHNHNQGRYISQ